MLEMIKYSFVAGVKRIFILESASHGKLRVITERSSCS
jgi:hypothetical protein